MENGLRVTENRPAFATNAGLGIKRTIASNAGNGSGRVTSTPRSVPNAVSGVRRIIASNVVNGSVGNNRPNAVKLPAIISEILS